MRDIEFHGRTYVPEALRDYVADPAILAGARPCMLLDGPERGVRAVDVWTGSGLEFTVLPDRGMNICNARFRGIPLDWSSGTGMTSPFLYDAHEWRWLRSFHGGLLHTCGLSNVGDPCRDAGLLMEEESYGGHGRISNTPASQVAWKVNRDNQPAIIELTGVCRIASAQGEKLELERSITSEVGGRSIVIEDRVRNLGFNRTPVFLLYHCNFGFPLLSEESELLIPAAKAYDQAGNEVADSEQIDPPSDSPDEQVLYPVLTEDHVEVGIHNPGLGRSGLGMMLKYNRSQLPQLTLWKFLQKRSYVIGIEPGTCRVEGRVAEREAGRAVFLDADETHSVRLEFEIREGTD